jgi:hypothetical protein
MIGGNPAAAFKKTSTLRRVAPLEIAHFRPVPGGDGDICAFELPHGAAPFMVESTTGRFMTIAPGDTFLATPGHRESTRWVVGGIPAGGLATSGDYWVLSDSGIVGELIGDSPLQKAHLAQVRYIGAVCGDSGDPLNIRQFAATAAHGTDRQAPVFLVLGTSSEVGKTTAGIAVLRALRQKPDTSVIVLKATGTSSFAELATYQDFGSAQAFDCIDFGLPSTYPSGRRGISEAFDGALDFCLSLSADAVIVECGGDLFGANVPEFLACLKARRSRLTVVLAASDALAAIGAKQVLSEIGLTITLIAGPCTDTPTLRERTQALCGVPALNLARDADRGIQTLAAAASGG